MSSIIEQLQLDKTFFYQLALITGLYLVLSQVYFKPFLKLFQKRHDRTVNAQKEAERMVQRRLARMIGGASAPVDAGRRLGDAAANVIAYLDHLGVQSEDSQAQAVRVLTAALAGRQNPSWPRC